MQETDIDTLDRIDTMLNKLERLGKLMLLALGLIITGAVWAASMQSRVSNLESEQAGMKPQIQQHDKAISNIEGRLHGIASQVGKVPSRVAAKLNEADPPQ